MFPPFSGKIKLSFVTHQGFDMFEKMCGFASPFRDINEPFDFAFIVNDKDGDRRIFRFHKKKLMLISQVFRAMLENENTMEAKNGELILIDCEAATIKTFHDILYENVVDFNQVGLDLDFLLFIHKYDITAMYSATQR